MARQIAAIRNATSVASAATVDISAVNTAIVNLTGSVTVSAITMRASTICHMLIAAVPKFVHSAALDLPGAEDRTWDAGTWLTLRADGSANVSVIAAQRGDGGAELFPSSAAMQAHAAMMVKRTVGGRRMPGFRLDAGRELSLQPNLAEVRVSRWIASGGGSTQTTLDGSGGISSTGTLTARNCASTNLFTSMRRAAYVSAVSAGATAELRTHNTSPFWRGNAAGHGGFHAVFRFGGSDAATVADARMFAGFYGSASAIGNVNPSSLVNIIGLGCDNGAANLSVMHNDGSGTATSIALGANFPANTLSVDMYDLKLYAPPNGAFIRYQVERLNTGDVATGEITTDLPSSTQFLTPHFWRNSGATALAVGIDICFAHIETDY